MQSQEPIKLSSFRSEASRSYSKSVERQYRVTLGLITALCIATGAALLTLNLTVGQTNTESVSAKTSMNKVYRG